MPESVRMIRAGLVQIVRILMPKALTIRARARVSTRGKIGRVLLLSTLGVVFWALIFGIVFRLLSYFRNVPELGSVLAAKLLGLVLLGFLGLLLLSNVITALSTFFLARDLDMLVGSPVGRLSLYGAKLLETGVNSSWMVLLMAVPIFTAYGMAYHGGWWFAPVVAAALIPFLIIPTAFGAAVTLLLVTVLPARRTREMLGTFGIIAGAGTVVAFRLLRPERLVHPEGFRSLVDFLAVVRAPTSPLLPSEWVQSAVMGWLRYDGDGLSFLMLWAVALVLLAVGAVMHRNVYARAYSKAQDTAGRGVVRHVSRASMLLSAIPSPRRELLLKELRVFFRDSTQWSQLILLVVLVFVYVFNVRFLPVSGDGVTFMLANIIPFLNLILAGFVLASVAARFLFPSVSTEGRTWWLLKSSPLSMRDLLWAKFWVGTLPLLALALAIVFATDVLLGVTQFMTAVSIGTITMMTFALAGLAIGLGTLFPQFETENVAQIPTSFGGLLMMMSAISLIAGVVLLEARPVYAYLSARAFGTPLDATDMITGFAAAGTLCLAVTFAPISLAIRRLETLER